MLTQRSGKIAITVAIRPTDTNETEARGPGDPPRPRDPPGADRHADHRHRGDAERERDRGQQEFEPRADAVAGQDLGAELASMWVKMLMVSTDCSGEKQETAPTFRMSKNIAH